MASITGCCPNLFIIFGLFFAYIFSFILGLISFDMTGASTWQIIFLFPIVFIGAQTYFLYKVYPFETPKYLAECNKEADLKLLLSKFYK
jgi:hypothetical protein